MLQIIFLEILKKNTCRKSRLINSFYKYEYFITTIEKYEQMLYTIPVGNELKTVVRTLLISNCHSLHISTKDVLTDLFCIIHQ